MATTSTFNLRKLIQTRLHQEGDPVIDDDSSSFYEDDLRNPIKRRLATWLAPRIGSAAGTVHARSSSDMHRAPSPPPPPPTHPTDDPVYQKQVREAADLLHSEPPAPWRTHKRRTRSDVPCRSNFNETDLGPLDTLFLHPTNHIDSNTSAQDPGERRPRTFLASPAPSSPRDPASPTLAFLDDAALTAPGSEAMGPSLQDRLDPAVNRQSLSRDLSEGVRQLIEETDLAFESVGNAIDAHNSLDLPRMSPGLSCSNPDLTSQLAPSPLMVDKQHEEDKENVGPKAEATLDVSLAERYSRPDDAALTERRKSRSVPPPIDVRRASSPSIREEKKQPSPAPPAPMSAREPPPHLGGNSRNKTPVLRFGGGHHNYRPARPAPRRPSKTTRWAIPDVSEILTGNVFKRSEVDELLTPEQLEKLKREREEAKRKESMPKPPKASSDSDLNRSSIEEQAGEEPGRNSHSSQHSKSSHNSNPSQTTFAGTERFPNSCDVAISPPSRVDGVTGCSDETPQLPAGEGIERKPVPPKKSERRKEKDTGEEDDTGGDDGGDGLMTFEFLEEPPSSESAGGPAPPPKNPKRYDPPTAELPPIPESKGTKRRKASATLHPEEDDEHFYLKSTPYSLTTPSFRHGPISFAKSELGKGALTMDDTLDWTAFQMAILGAGELIPDLYDECDSKYAEDVAAWFSGFGFDTHGELIPEAWPPSPRSSSQSTISSAPSADGDLPIPADNSDFDTTRFFQGNGLKRFTMEGKPRKEPHLAQHRRDNSDSAMLPIVVNHEDEKIACVQHEEVPMGYNLQGDLGDFLQWEAQHAFAGGYYGAHY